jgi:hypothetical protein
MIPSDAHTLPEKSPQRYVFLGRPRRVQTMSKPLASRATLCPGSSLPLRVLDLFKGVADRCQSIVRLLPPCVFFL